MIAQEGNRQEPSTQEGGTQARKIKIGLHDGKIWVPAWVRETTEAKKDNGGSEVFAKATELLRLLRAPKDKGGLGLVYRNHIEPEADINEAIKRGYIRCSEFQTLFYGIGLLLGLKMYPIEIPQVDGDGNDQPHGAVMVVDESNGKQFFVDFQLNGVRRESPYREYYVGTAADLFSIYLFNRSMIRDGNEAKVSTADNTPLRAAEDISPHNAIVLFGLGVYYFKRENWKTAVHYFRRVVEVRRNHTPALRNLCFLTLDAEICDKIPPRNISSE